MKQKLFVYGTLRPKGPNTHILEDIGGHFLKASVRGRLINSGWGAELGYPALSLSDKSTVVEGHVFISDNLSQHWKTLDSFEGAGYERVTTQVELSDQSVISAFVYVVAE